MHEFEIAGVRYGVPSVDSYINVKNENSFKLGELLTKPKMKFKYIYDFGDNWEHEIVVEDILAPQSGQDLPVCVTGRRAAPPEDLGGVWGYQALMEAKVNPRHPEREHFAELIENFDPEAFDAEVFHRSAPARRR
jgi:hypothetical protein